MDGPLPKTLFCEKKKLFCEPSKKLKNISPASPAHCLGKKNLMEQLGPEHFVHQQSFYESRKGEKEDGKQKICAFAQHKKGEENVL
jgi:hypothetical protein